MSARLIRLIVLVLVVAVTTTACSRKKPPVARPTPPPPYNEIAYAGQNGPGFDIKIFDLQQGQIRVVTDGTGSNESPAWSPNGRHLAFASTRAGRSQIFTIARDGQDLRQVTKSGNNVQPSWSR